MMTTADLPVYLRLDVDQPHDCGHVDCGAPVQNAESGVPSGR